MHVFTNPGWLEPLAFPYRKYDEIPASVFDEINRDLDRVTSKRPLVSILIAAWNEEVNVLRCIASLSRIRTAIPFEIIVINNNSTDRTQDTLDRLHVKALFQSIQGCGPARQVGLEQAKGEYILLADADCMYPAGWLDGMIRVLQQPGVVCVYGRYSFIGEAGFPRWKLFVLERMKDVIAEVRHFKRPYLNAFGISMGFIREYGAKIGFVMTGVWGDDGRMCYDLMAYGKVKQVKADAVRPWTAPRTLRKDGSFGKAFVNRVLREVKRLSSMLRPLPAHDTKTSTNN